MSSSQVTLYGDAFWISPYFFTAYVSLREKGVPFRVQTVALQNKEQHAPAFAQRSPTSRVPSIEHDGFVLAESNAIVEYLEDTFAPPQYTRLLPNLIRERATARQVLAWIRSDLLALRTEYPTSSMFYEPAKDALSTAGEAAAKRLLEISDRLIPAGKTQLFSEWSVADADLAFMLHRLILNNYEVPEKQSNFARAQWARPSVAEFVQRKREAYEPY